MTKHSFNNLRRLHIVLDGTTSEPYFAYVPYDFDKIVLGLDVFQLQSVVLLRAKSANLSLTAECLDATDNPNVCAWSKLLDVDETQRTRMRSLSLQNIDRRDGPIDWTLNENTDIFRGLRFLQMTSMVVATLPTNIHAQLPAL